MNEENPDPSPVPQPSDPIGQQPAPPSGPIPVLRQDEPAVVLLPPLTDPDQTGPVRIVLPPARSGTKAVRVVAALAIVFFVAAGTLGTLWFIERNDHKTTIGQLNATRTEADDNKSKEQAAEARVKASDNRLTDMTDERDRLQVQLRADDQKIADLAKEPTPCADAGRAVTTAAMAGDEAGTKAAFVKLVTYCH